MKRDIVGSIGKKMIKIVDSVALIKLIGQQAENKSDILFYLLDLQERYKKIKILNIFCLGLLFFRFKEINKEYNKYPKEIELLHKLYLITL